ncbi:MAG: aldehyde dehydrogenase family protein [Deltaproteobacteria bacterium]|nr:aldehyde dehydrogenase family protein [Deltaproteobacteria bacterium]
MTTSVDQRLAEMFPRRDSIPAEHDFPAGGGTYAGGRQYLVDGEVRTWSGAVEDVSSPVCLRADGGAPARRVLGPAAQLTRDEALAALAAADRAWDKGRGKWPTMRVQDRIHAVQAFTRAMQGVREECVRLLMWEIGKTRADSEKEFDRTVQYVDDTVEALKEVERTASRFSRQGGVLAQIRRAPLGVTLCMGPFNYPLNETFTTLIPALIMGNPVVVKLPRFGALCQAPLLPLFAAHFPRGVVNIINGQGPVVAGPLLESGKVNVLAFIGSSRVANILKKQHPLPNRLRCVLGLDAKNPALVLPDADLDLAVREVVNGALTFNGQRCTGLKLIYVHRSLADRFVRALSDAVDALPFGMPWEKGVRLTPLPELDKPAWMGKLVDDARKHGASVANAHGGKTVGTFYFPSVVYPVVRPAQLYTVEQFGPVVPVCVYDDVATFTDDVADSNYGQQVSLFGRDPPVLGPLVDFLVNQVSRVNLNAQCQRGPDVYPFTGRKDSAEATLSVSDALRCFSIRAMVAMPDGESNHALVRDLLRDRKSSFINTDYIF